MKAADADLLFVPGRARPDADHWQTRWGQRLSTARTLAPDDPLVEAVRAARRPVVLIAHRDGVARAVAAAQALAAEGLGARVAGGFFVAPDADAIACPRDPLPFPALLVASRNDPALDFDAAGDVALAWGAALVDAGEAGAIDAASGHGPWPEGLMRLAGFLARL